MKVITLTSDFGLTDSYVGVMKGVILGIAPQARIVDISHQVPPQDLRAAAYLLRGALPYFPAGTIHIVVVDPGVGSQRRPIALQTPTACFVGPDNGLFSPVLAGDEPVEVLHLDNPAYWLTDVSMTFHGRDIFSPVGAHLAAGVPFEKLGTTIDDPIIWPESPPQRLPDGRLRGEIIYCDHFGNLISNIPGQWLAGRSWTIEIAGRQLAGPSQVYAAVDSGDLLALVSSGGILEVAVRDGSAARRLRVGVGERIEAVPRET